jgi:hypothetical protein
MPQNDKILFGVCPESECDRSYKKGSAIPKGFKHWLSGALLPGGGDGQGPRNSSLEEACGIVFHASASAHGFCDSCGRELVFSVQAPALGVCSECNRQYVRGDLQRAFCPKCGSPIDIPESARELIDPYREIVALLDIVPDLQEYGYLPGTQTPVEIKYR